MNNTTTAVDVMDFTKKCAEARARMFFHDSMSDIYRSALGGQNVSEVAVSPECVDRVLALLATHGYRKVNVGEITGGRVRMLRVYLDDETDRESQRDLCEAMAYRMRLWPVNADPSSSGAPPAKPDVRTILGALPAPQNKGQHKKPCPKCGALMFRSRPVYSAGLVWSCPNCEHEEGLL